MYGVNHALQTAPGHASGREQCPQTTAREVTYMMPCMRTGAYEAPSLPLPTGLTQQPPKPHDGRLQPDLLHCKASTKVAHKNNTQPRDRLQAHTDNPPGCLARSATSPQRTYPNFSIAPGHTGSSSCPQGQMNLKKSWHPPWLNGGCVATVRPQVRSTQMGHDVFPAALCIGSHSEGVAKPERIVRAL
jgi:hypothetical protein